MKYLIQSIVFPTQKKHFACQELFYKSDGGILDANNHSLKLGFAQRCDFSTYLNACSWKKWRTYTSAKDLQLTLEVEGALRVQLVGYAMDKGILTQTLLAKKDFQTKGREKITLACPESDDWVIGFEITALAQELTIYGGGFEVETAEETLNDVTLSLASTTYRKEEFIKKTVELIKREIFAKNDEMAENFYCHIVDNGRTLEDDFCTDRIFLHPAENTGGSGGFSRGMIESLAQEPKATHVLLMDDDVLVLPESIRRTYNLLRLLKPEFKDDIIAGAMLYYEIPSRMHEDVGNVDAANNYQPSKPEYDLTLIENVVLNEQQQRQKPGSYSAWWFSCIPATVIEENGLSLPIFVRGDDTEYGIRTGSRFLTMNGLCIWHMGFTNKTNPALRYFGVRNCLIMHATTGVASEASMMQLVRDTYRTAILRFDYLLADIVVQAFEDYLKGPGYLAEVDNAGLMQKYSAAAQKFVPLEQLEGGEAYLENEVIDNTPLSIIERLFMKYTMNGQKLVPERFCNRGLGKNLFGYPFAPKSVMRCDRVLLIDPVNKTGAIYKKDKARFAEIDTRYQRAMQEYKEHGQQIKENFRQSRQEITSIDYWRRYLGLDA